jgi:hypothetical protein
MIVKEYLQSAEAVVRDSSEQRRLPISDEGWVDQSYVDGLLKHLFRTNVSGRSSEGTRPVWCWVRAQFTVSSHIALCKNSSRDDRWAKPYLRKVG